MRSKTWLFCAVVVLAALPLRAQTSTVGRIHIVERGIYRAQTVRQTATPGTTGLINTVENAQLINSTTSVLGMLGLRFGLRYVVVGDGSGSGAMLKLVIKFPPVGLRNPATGEVIFQNEHTVSVPTGARLYWEYHFENHWEIVPGMWNFEFWDGNRKLAEQRFCVRVLSDRQRPSLLSECRWPLVG